MTLSTSQLKVIAGVRAALKGAVSIVSEVSDSGSVFEFLSMFGHNRARQ